jgi:(5-formylfuran-3-yl)methyl phosphate synthase
MTQLLISVKDVEEARIAFAADADVIDLKDPNIGALGALDIETTLQITEALDGGALLSATVGENHTSLGALVQSIEMRADCGIDIIKIAVSDFFYHNEFFTEIQRVTNGGVKLVAVFFGDEAIDFDLFSLLQQTGFYGAMLDTKTKLNSLLEHRSEKDVNRFLDKCNTSNLICGLAGSLKIQDIDYLVALNPTFIGMRGGVCENNVRKSRIDSAKVQQARNMLLEHNNIAPQGHKSLSFVLNG